MASQSLKRKAQRNKTRGRVRQEDIKRLNAMPVIKNVDIEEIKASFKKSAKKVEAEKPAEEVKTEKAPKAEKKESAAPKAKKTTAQKKDAE